MLETNLTWIEATARKIFCTHTLKANQERSPSDPQEQNGEETTPKILKGDFTKLN